MMARTVVIIQWVEYVSRAGDGASHLSGTRLGDGCVQIMCVLLVSDGASHFGVMQGPDLVTIVYNLGVWSLSVMVHRTSVYGTRLGDGCVQFRCVELVMVHCSGTRLGDGCVQFRCGVIAVIVYCTQIGDE